jgi:CRISPR system Cascade subunit CasA
MTAIDTARRTEGEAPRFNLIDEPWIPVRRLDGKRCEVGIRKALLGAAEIAEIQDASPLVVAALHRLLLAVLYRALSGPVDGRQAKDWFKSGWPPDRIDDYLTRWRDRFWLFHPCYPFAQVPDFEPKIWRAWTVLAAEHNADNAKVLFDHVDVNHAGAIGAAQAARWLLAAQTFSVSAGKSELAHTGTAPSATAAMVIVLGRHLGDTLAYLLAPENRAVLNEDRPLWEREPETLSALRSGCERNVDGFADRYTWRTRSIRLRRNAQGNVTQIAFASGVGANAEHHRDPMVAYRIDEKKGRLPVIFRDRGLWRDFDSLLPDADGEAPQVIVNGVALGRYCPDRFPRAVIVAGQSSDKAKIEYWRLERFDLPQALHGDRHVRKELRDLLGDAEEAERALWSSCAAYARDLLSRGARKPEARDVRAFVSQMPGISTFWSRLEARFHGVLREYTEQKNADDIRRAWLQGVRSALEESWTLHATSDGGDAWAIRARIRGERFVLRHLTELARSINSLKPETEPA